MANVIENPILNSPYEAPTRYWKFDDDGITDQVQEGRRPSAYFMPIPAAKRRQAAQAQLEFVEWTKDRIEETRFVNEVRLAVDRWRMEGWPGATATTRLLLEHWNDPERERRLFFCQIEAVETAMWLAEIAGKSGRAAYFINEVQRYNDDANPGLFRVAHKMATGTGKTAVMSMIIAWQTLNKAANLHDGRFSDAFLVVAPGITIRDRLRVLFPSDSENYYRGLDVVPSHLRDQLGQARIVVTNFHGFLHREKVSMPKATRELLGADVRGAFTETPDQMVRRVCRDLGTKKNIVVLNDEAHHCYRIRITCPDWKLNRGIKVRVFIDGADRGYISQGGSIEMTTTSGDHEVAVVRKASGRFDLNVHVEPGACVELACTGNPEGELQAEQNRFTGEWNGPPPFELWEIGPDGLPVEPPPLNAHWFRSIQASRSAMEVGPRGMRIFKRIVLDHQVVWSALVIAIFSYLLWSALQNGDPDWFSVTISIFMITGSAFSLCFELLFRRWRSHQRAAT